MNLLKMLIPSGEKKEVDVVETWEVRWISRRGRWHTDTQEEVEIFVDEQAAKDFKKALQDAFKLLKFKQYYETTVELKKRHNDK